MTNSDSFYPRGRAAAVATIRRLLLTLPPKGWRVFIFCPSLPPMPARHSAPALIAYATALLLRAGLDADKAATVAAILVEADLLGHTTHGLALLPAYLAEIEKGAMTKTGEPRVIADWPAAITWDGQRLPGPWLVVRALDLAIARAKINGTCTVVIRRSHHIACLAAYLQRVTDQGLMALLSCSDPAVASVAPHGGRVGIYTPNPIAAAWPTAGDPVMLDVSVSITTNALTNRLRSENKNIPASGRSMPAANRPTIQPSSPRLRPARCSRWEAWITGTRATRSRSSLKR